MLILREMIMTSDLRDEDYELIKAAKKISSDCSCLLMERRKNRWSAR